MEDAVKLFNQMAGKHHAHNFVRYNILIDGLCKTEIHKAFRLSDVMLRKGHEPNTINLRPSWIDYASNIQEFKKLVCKILKEGYSFNLLHSLF